MVFKSYSLIQLKNKNEMITLDKQEAERKKKNTKQHNIMKHFYTNPNLHLYKPSIDNALVPCYINQQPLQA